MSDDIRMLIREVLAEELRAHRARGNPPMSVDEETVPVPADGDVTTFVRGILERAEDPAFAADVMTGKRRFRLSARTQVQTASAPMNEAVVDSPITAPNPPVIFEKGLITEKQVATLPEGTVIHASKTVTFTPLALDELRRRRIRMERKTP